MAYSSLNTNLVDIAFFSFPLLQLSSNPLAPPQPKKKEKKTHYLGEGGSRGRNSGGTANISRWNTREPSLIKPSKQIKILTQSPSVSEAGTITLISLDLAVVIDAPRESLLKYNWHPAVLSTDIVGAEPCIRKLLNSDAKYITLHLLVVMNSRSSGNQI